MQSYYRFSQYLKKRFACKVYKISVDAGFSCPNRDGTKSREGCIYCNNKAFSLYTREGNIPLREQIIRGIDYGRKRFQARKFIVYFQAYTNTYAPVSVLEERYGIIREFEDIVGLSIGTRPDCVDEEILDVIKVFSKDYDVWLEYGLQSIHKDTLDATNRNHYYDDFLRAVELARRGGVKVCAHVIVGLPRENREMMLETAKEMGRLRLEAIKLHPLHIVKDTKMEDIFKRGLYKPLGLEEYVDIVSRLLEFLWPQTVIQRLSADCPREYLIAPLWLLNKQRVLSSIEERMKEENRFQGRLYSKS